MGARPTRAVLLGDPAVLVRLAGSRSQHRLSVATQLSSVTMPGGSSMRVTRHRRVLQFSI
jgi:hypothetical protein